MPEKQGFPAQGGANSGALAGAYGLQASSAPPPGSLEMLAAALLKLSPSDRAKLAALLQGQPSG
jgi:hypothetical protein